MALIRRGIHFGSYGSVDDGAAVFGRLAEAARAAEESGFDTSDLAALAASARSWAKPRPAGADGMIIVGPADPAAIGPIGQALAEVFPG